MWSPGSASWAEACQITWRSELLTRRRIDEPRSPRDNEGFVIPFDSNLSIYGVTVTGGVSAYPDTVVEKDAVFPAAMPAAAHATAPPVIALTLSGSANGMNEIDDIGFVAGSDVSLPPTLNLQPAAVVNPMSIFPIVRE